MKKAVQPLPTDTADTVAYDIWARQQIEATVKAKAEGRLTYRPLNEIAAKYGFDEP